MHDWYLLSLLPKVQPTKQMNNSRGENLVKMCMGANIGAEMIAVKDHSFRNYFNHTAHISLVDNVMFLVSKPN